MHRVLMQCFSPGVEQVAVNWETAPLSDVGLPGYFENQVERYFGILPGGWPGTGGQIVIDGIPPESGCDDLPPLEYADPFFCCDPLIFWSPGFASTNFLLITA